MTKYYCDKCGKEVGLTERRELVIPGYGLIMTKTNGVEHWRSVELCFDCCELLRGVLSEWITPKD